MIIEGRAAAAPSLRRAVTAFLVDQASAEDWLQWDLLGSGAALALWDFTSWSTLSTRHQECVRASGALAPPSAALNAQRVKASLFGDFDTGARKASYGAYCSPHTRAGPRKRHSSSPRPPATPSHPGRDSGLHHANWATAVLHNGLGHYTEALPAAEQAAKVRPRRSSGPLLEPETRETCGRCATATVGNDSPRGATGPRASRPARRH